MMKPNPLPKDADELVALAEGIAQGELRPLRRPDDGDDLTVGAA